MSAPDADLVRLAQDGDLDAYAELVTRYRTGLERYAAHLLGNREEAEEALQDSLVRAYRAIGRCEQPERFRAWLARILVNRCRTRLARAEPPVRDAERDRALDHASVSHTAERSALGEEIQRALRVLASDQREAFLLRHVEEFSYQEMAVLTGASVAALKMRVSRACERLRAELREVYRG
jgi:RNA polymerase sigma-70 factor (ECF subfamily)